MIRSIFLAIALLLCGVAYAGPTSSLLPHPGPADHPLVVHQELADPMFCAASYIVVLEQLMTDPGTSTAQKMDLLGRAEGLIDWLESVAGSWPHEDEEWYALSETMLEETRRFANDHFNHWLAAGQAAGCREMTNQWGGSLL